MAKYRGWNGVSADHTYSWHDSIDHTTIPWDDNNHGTHTTGTMIGDDGGENQIGVAPGARWIGCRNMNYNVGQPSTYLECMQWALAPYKEGMDPMTEGHPELAADITNNSWTCPSSEGCSATTLQEAFDNIRAAGQLTVAAASNNGYACSTVADPPALYDSVFALGALSNSSGIYRIASFSSRGPVISDGSGRMKPDISAPGVSICSSIRGGLYSCGYSGTSMASPHAAGAMALLWSARPELRDHLGISRCYFEQSAGTVATTTIGPTSCGTTAQTDHPNNFWGYGIVNVYAAIHLGPDSDGDGIADACDCAPTDATLRDAPPEVIGDLFAPDRQTYSWKSVASYAGSGTHYDVLRGLVSELVVDYGFIRSSCLAAGVVGTSTLDASAPPVGDAFYYLVRGRSICGTGTWGNDSWVLRWVPTNCP